MVSCVVPWVVSQPQYELTHICVHRDSDQDKVLSVVAVWPPGNLELSKSHLKGSLKSHYIIKNWSLLTDSINTMHLMTCRQAHTYITQGTVAVCFTYIDYKQHIFLKLKKSTYYPKHNFTFNDHERRNLFFLYSVFALQSYHVYVTTLEACCEVNACMIFQQWFFRSWLAGVMYINPDTICMPLLLSARECGEIRDAFPGYNMRLIFTSQQSQAHLEHSKMQTWKNIHTLKTIKKITPEKCLKNLTHS